MDKRDFSAADVLTAVQTINHHVKDLQKLAILSCFRKMFQ